MPEIKKAMVFAAGLGTRMRPITNEIPKAMVKVKGKPLLDWTLDLLEDAGIEEAVVNTHYKAEIIHQHLKQRQSPKIKISHEENLLETGGGIIKALNFFNNEPFLTINTDIIFIKKDINPVTLLNKTWKTKPTGALLLMVKTSKAIGYEGKGDFDLEASTLKKDINKSAYPYIYSGMQILRPEFLSNPPGEIFSLNHFYKNNHQPDGSFKNMVGIEFDGHWLHIGTPGMITAAEKYIDSLA